MNGRGQSDGSVVPRKPSNKRPGAPGRAEGVEGRGPTEGSPSRQPRHRAQHRARLQQALARIRQAARKDRKARFTTLWHHVYDVARLREAYFGLTRDSAPGVDGRTWKAYGEQLEDNLQELSGRLKRGAYRAKAVRRVYIPKADGRQRPIGVPALEDKIVQRAAAEVMGAVYEVDFLGFSYGFRPGRSQHNALDAVTVGIERKKVNWILDADIRAFFDSMDHEWLLKFVEHRIADKRVLRHVKKWLNAGVMEDGVRHAVERGTPQGGSISPLLANVYLHYALDTWAQKWRERRARGDVIIVRYADDGAPRRAPGWKEAGMEKPRRARRRKLDTAKVDLKPLRAQPRQPCCTRDEGGPLGTGRQGRVSNHRMLLRLNGRGGERFGKRWSKTPSGRDREGERE